MLDSHWGRAGRFCSAAQSKLCPAKAGFWESLCVLSSHAKAWAYGGEELASSGGPAQPCKLSCQFRGKGVTGRGLRGRRNSAVGRAEAHQAALLLSALTPS